MYAELRSLSSLEKLFVDEAPASAAPEVQGFQNEVVSWQVAMILRDASRSRYVRAEVAPEYADYVRVYQVRHVPVHMPTYEDADDNYLRKTPGLYPDLLSPLRPHSLRIYASRWTSLWIEFDPRGMVEAGTHEIGIRLYTEEGEFLGEQVQTVQELPGELPEQKLIHTKWFHADCLASFYQVETFSEEHWAIIERFVRCAVEGGINMILMPIHTPPLDTREGGERPTTQLAGIRLEDGKYQFDFTLVRRWIAMCRRCGVKYYEMAHLFTQWGAKHAPKIVADTPEGQRQIFGWDTDAAGEEYGAFLKAYIPALRKVFREEGIDQDVWWHISDEPSKEHLPHYLAARRQVDALLEGAKVTDALSDIDFYQQGVVERPVVASNHMQPFLDAQVPDLWMYYCCGQYKDVSNVFLAMPSARTRVLGAQLFRCGVQGFLQWGFNYYYSQYSDYLIDPYFVTDGDGFVPSGDPFQVYPGPGGEPELSIRYMTFREAMQDLRALEWLADLIGHDKADQLLGSMTLSVYPTSAEALLALRREINSQILAHS